MESFPENSTLIRMPRDGHSLFRALWTARSTTGEVANLLQVSKTREDIANSIIHDHTPFFVQFFEQLAPFTGFFATLADDLRELIIDTTFKTMDYNRLLELKQLMRRIGHLDLNTLLHSPQYRRCVKMYADMLSVPTSARGRAHGEAWGGTVEIQAFANLTNRPVIVYGRLGQTTTLVEYRPQHRYPVAISPRDCLTKDTIAIVRSQDIYYYDALVLSWRPNTHKKIQRKRKRNNENTLSQFNAKKMRSLPRIRTK